MTAHTPGPWHLHADGKTILSNQSHPVATLSDPGHRQVMGERGGIFTGNDGPIIAAAPELLDACRAALDEHGKSVLFSGRALRLLELAIAKATGGAP